MYKLNDQSPSKNHVEPARELSPTCKREVGERKYWARNEMN